MHQPSNNVIAIGFCPFCRESFENLALCPEHELPLVEWHELPPDPFSQNILESETEVLSFGFSYGRAWLCAGALCLLVGFFLDAFSVTLSRVASPSAFELANTKAFNLWTIPLCSFVVFAICYRRRTLVRMQSARAALLLVALMPMVSLIFTFLGVRRWLGSQRDFSLLEPRGGLFLLGLGIISMVVGALRFGVPRRSRHIHE
ncbi:MAG: hypothetical protein IPJ88_09560 [Myxococcales bacterium]|nr:MAG: hypothetical protein IPJ88_09560 [Myxococcales bacterium]